MLLLKTSQLHLHVPLVPRSPSLLRPTPAFKQAKKAKARRVVVKACQGEKGQRRSFLSLEEAGLVEMSGLSTHERFLCRLTVGSLKVSIDQERTKFMENVLKGSHNKIGRSQFFLSKISSLNLLRVISEQEAVPIEELNAGQICDWFLKDKLKREQDSESAVLQWDDSEFQM